MGIKDLWTILSPFCERKPLYELQNKRVAIDLSGWVCQAQCITDYSVHPKMYLRNLYFRTCFLLLHDVWPVFVLEGSAPSLKHKTIAARNEIQFKGAKPRSPTKNNGDERKRQQKGGRTRFDNVLKQCEALLNIMGLSCVVGSGEAEAMCAYLNQNGWVEGCISQDSDCFAYGATRVYRNFSISTQGAHVGGCIDIYDIETAHKSIDFGRNKAIALAILLGSDYNDGVYGVGKDSVTKLFGHIKDVQVLDHLRSWKNDSKQFEALERKVLDANRCTQCGHIGKKVAHTKKGCLQCRTNAGEQCLVDEGHANMRNELAVRQKAVANEQFPNEELIAEFLKPKETLNAFVSKWKMPDVPKFLDFCLKFLQWEEIYSFRHIFPILTRWIILNDDGKCKDLPTSPQIIKKVRNPKGVASYEIEWSNAHLLHLIPKEQLEGIDCVKLFSSIEPQAKVDVCFGDLVATFWKSKEKPKRKERKRPNKPEKNHDEDEDDNKLVENPQNGLKNIQKTKNKTEKTQSKRENSKNKAEKRVNLTNNAGISKKKQCTISDLPKTEEKTLDDSLFDVESDDNLDLSLIVEEMTSRDLPKVVKEKVNELARQKVILANDEDEVMHGSFFELNEDENDLFEKSIYVLNSDNEVSSSDSHNSSHNSNVCDAKEIVNSLEGVVNDKNDASDSKISSTEINNDANDTFMVEEYVPLIDRIKKRLGK